MDKWTTSTVGFILFPFSGGRCSVMPFSVPARGRVVLSVPGYSPPLGWESSVCRSPELQARSAAQIIPFFIPLLSDPFLHPPLYFFFAFSPYIFHPFCAAVFDMESAVFHVSLGVHAWERESPHEPGACMIPVISCCLCTVDWKQKQKLLWNS